MKRLLLALLLIGASLPAYAQNPVVTTPSALTISPLALSITSSSAFQSVLPASTNTTGRIDCIIQNLHASRVMYLFFGAPAQAISQNSLTLAAGATFRCNNGGVVIKNQISIGGTAGDRFLAGQ